MVSYFSSAYGYTIDNGADGIYDLTWKGQSSIVGGDIQDVRFEIVKYENILRLKVDSLHCL